MPTRSPKYRMIILILLAAISGGGISVFGKIALASIPSFSFTLLRFVFATIFLFPFFLRSKPKFSSDLYKLMFFSLLASANVLLFSFGVKNTTAGITQTIYSCVPLIAAVLSYFLLKEKYNLAKTTGLAIGFIGTGIVVLQPVLNAAQNQSITLFGNLLILIAALAYACYLILSKNIQKKYTPVQVTFYFALTTTYLTAVLATMDLVRFPGWWEKVSYRELGATLYVGVIGTAIFYLINQLIIQRSTPLISSLTLYLQPLATFIWAYFLLNEKLSPLFLLGFGLCMLGVYLVTVTGIKKDET